MLLGQESTDDATIGAGSSWLSFSDLFRIADSLTENESFALRRAILHGHDINRIAEELEISRADASSLLECAKEKMTSEITAKGLGRRAWSRREKVDRFAERRSPSLKRSNTFVSKLMLTVQGDNNGIADFESALHYNLPQVEVIGYKPADSPLGDVTLELEFRPPVLVEHAIRAVDETAIETGIAPSTLMYSHFEP